ncbi:hypothetical protein EI42_06422 [Thermosporothrix hazakensis]|uniref:N-acetyltransferase domain-containing protein n=2 Tax=Thermosporothrix hazakensis TaxID=644383 RepID=A0A326TNS9_THEHA|nr:hypothetical protein EI42_06422 [Thermosporothrix hazakensis]
MSRSGGFGIPPEKLDPFLRIPEVAHFLYRQGKLVGYFTLVPLNHEIMLKRLRGEVRITQLKPEDLEEFDPEHPIDCFVWELITNPDDKHLAAYLIQKLQRFIHTLGKRGVRIESICATATSPEGINLCRRLGMRRMTEIQTPYKQERAFEMRPMETKNWLTRNYQQGLKSYQLKLERLNRGY